MKNDPNNIIIDYNDVEICRDDLVVLKHVTLHVKEGEFVYLIGKVGSGKSSLLKTLYGEIPVSTGYARIFDYDLNHLKRKSVPYLRREIGVVFQDFQLLTDRDVKSNLEFVLRATGWKNKAEIAERVEEVLKTVGMSKKDYKWPHELSGGEQQRVAIARALLNHPKLILADEPTGNLDPETARNVMETLHDVAEKGTAVIMATHNLSFVKEFPERTIKIENKLAYETDSRD